MASSSHNFHPSSDEVVTVVVLGASGDLAHKKTYPSLYDLFIADLLPKKVTIIGFARSAMPDETFRNTIRGHLKGGSDEKLDAFLQLCIYRQGKYDDAEAFKKVRAADLLQLVHIVLRRLLFGSTHRVGANILPHAGGH